MVGETILREAGLSKWETQVYLALLELGSTTTGPLVQKSEVPQSKVYGVLDSLNKRGMVSYIVKGKIKYFQASDPEILFSIMKDKERKIREEIPYLKNLQVRAKNKQNVEIYEGKRAITSFFVNLIETSKKGDDWFSFSISDDQHSENAQIFWNKIGALRAEAGLNVKILDNTQYKKRLKESYSERWKFIKKIIRFSREVFPATTVLINNKIIILNFLSETETAVVISSKDLYNYYVSFFMQEWEKAKRVTD